MDKNRDKQEADAGKGIEASGHRGIEPSIGRAFEHRPVRDPVGNIEHDTVSGLGHSQGEKTVQVRPVGQEGDAARDLTLTDKAVGMLAMAEAGLVPQYTVQHHACSFDRCSCWCVYTPDRTLFVAIGPSDRDRAVAQKLVDKLNRDLARIRAGGGERQEAGGKGQEGGIEASRDRGIEGEQNIAGGTPVPAETTTHVRVGRPPAADPVCATALGSAEVGGGTAAGAGVGQVATAEGSDSDADVLPGYTRGKVMGADGVYRTVVMRDFKPSFRSEADKHAGGTPEAVPAKAADGDAIADEFAKAEAASIERDWDGFVTAEVAKPVTVGSVLRKVRAEVHRTTGDEQLAIRVEGAAAAEVSGLFREAENRGLMHLEAEVEWEGFESLSVGVGGVDACGVSRCSSVNLVSVEKVFNLLCDHEAAKSTLKAKVVTP